MKEEMTLKEFTEGLFKDNNIMKNMQLGVKLAEKLIELEAIENYINMMYGVELDIKVRPAIKKEGRFYGKGLLEDILA